jgi:hypothetical protein
VVAEQQAQAAIIQAAKQGAAQRLAAEQATVALWFQGAASRAANSNNPSLGLQVQLGQFDQQGQQQLLAFRDQLLTAYGAAFETTQDYANRIATAEEALGQQRYAIQKQYNDRMIQAEQQWNATRANLDARNLTALSTIYSDPKLALQAQLQSFDAAAEQQRQQLDQQLTAAYGDSIRATQDYANRVYKLDVTLYDERLALQKQFNDQLAQTANSAITSISDYVIKLQQGAASPLSPQGQLDQATKQFQAVAGAANQGDFNSLGQLTGYADQYLSASRAVYGSGQGYVDAFNKVVDTLDQIAQMPADNLTASVLRSETRSQTDALVAELAKVRAEIAALRLEVQTNGAMPPRLAA